MFVGTFILETYPAAADLRGLLWNLEVGVAVECVARSYGAQDRSAEFLNEYTIVDLITVVPTLVPFAIPVAGGVARVGFLRAVRIVRVVRFYRFTEDTESFFGAVTDNSLRAGRLLLTILVLLFVSAGLLYDVERAANPEVTTFGDAFYYAVISLSTTGFGDTIPVTTAERWVAVGSIPATIVVIPRQASKFVSEWTSKAHVDVTCPECGPEYHDADASQCKACGHVISQELDSRE